MSSMGICDECGKVATWSMVGSTGRVIIDGKDNNTQCCDLCNEHKPVGSFPFQPNNCKRVRFYWSGFSTK